MPYNLREKESMPSPVKSFDILCTGFEALGMLKDLAFL